MTFEKQKNPNEQTKKSEWCEGGKHEKPLKKSVPSTGESAVKTKIQANFDLLKEARKPMRAEV